MFNAPQVDHRGKESDLFHQSRRDVSVIGGKMGDVPVAEKDPDDRKTLPGLVFHEFCRIRERSDSLAPDHIPFGGQLLHGFADGLPADSELFRQFQNRRNPHGLTVRIENQAIDVLSDFFVLRHRVLPHPILLFCRHLVGIWRYVVDIILQNPVFVKSRFSGKADFFRERDILPGWIPEGEVVDGKRGTEKSLY